MKVKTIAVKVSAAAERKIKSGHPWIFDQSIERLSKEGSAGDLAIIYDRKSNKLLAVGLYDPSSVIRIKILSNQGGLQLDQDWFDLNLKHAFEKRNSFKHSYTNAYRIVHGENDGFPGLIVDRYADYLVVKVYSEIWLRYLERIQTALQNLTQSKGILLRTSRHVQKERKKDDPYFDGQVLLKEIPEEIVFMEHGLKFKTNLRKGHKTGHFLDQRHNRFKVSQLSKSKTVLDVFSYTGGFSVHAFQGGAKEVSSLDISEQALNLAEANVLLNFKKVQHNKILGDAFDTLKAMVNTGKQFDFVIIDPPSFAKRKEEVDIALKKYAQLVRFGCKLVAKNGLFFMASCSSRILNDTFFKIVDENVSSHRRKYKILEKTYHDIDHPILFPEASYLKAVFYSFD